MTQQNPAPACVNGIALHSLGEQPDANELRRRACFELLRQRAQIEALLDEADDAARDGVPSEAAVRAVERLLEREISVPEPDEADCRRHHAAHPERFASDEQLHLRHILFAVTQGVDVVALRKRAEQALIEVRARRGDEDEFAAMARSLSNCPSGERGGDIGWLVARDCASEFAREVFGSQTIGVLPRLVHSRFGLHVVEILAREPGKPQPFEVVAGTVQADLRQRAWIAAVRQYLALLAGEAQLEGVALDGSETPLVQ